MIIKIAHTFLVEPLAAFDSLESSSLLFSLKIPDFSAEKILSNSFSNISSSFDEVVLVDLVDTGVPFPMGVFLGKRVF